MACVDPATQLYAFCSAAVPLLISAHNMGTVGSGLVMGEDRPKVCSGLVATCLLSTSVVSAAVMRDFPLFFLPWVAVQYVFRGTV